MYGDGVLLYPGADLGAPGPLASLRMECIRNGTEDLALFRLAEQYLGRDRVLEQICRVTPSIADYSVSQELFAAVRKELGDELEAAIKAADN